MKGFAVIAALLLSSMLLVIGYAMANPVGGDAHKAPLLISALSVIVLPACYWMMASRRMGPAAGLVLTVAMVGIAAGLWLPILASNWRLEAHAGGLIFWTAVWLVAALPFVRLVIKGARARRLR